MARRGRSLLTFEGNVTASSCGPKPYWHVATLSTRSSAPNLDTAARALHAANELVEDGDGARSMGQLSASSAGGPRSQTEPRRPSIHTPGSYSDIWMGTVCGWVSGTQWCGTRHRRRVHAGSLVALGPTARVWPEYREKGHHAHAPLISFHLAAPPRQLRDTRHGPRV